MATFLIIDDSPYLAELLAEDFPEREHRIIRTANGEEALEQVRTCRPDIVLLDPFFESIEGWELLRRIKLDDSQLPVLIVTAYYGFINDSNLAQADGYVIKDIYPEPLKKKIEDVLARQALNQRL